jgi:sugar transferase (PEP-CTERM/EpsH1 system associated)
MINHFNEQHEVTVASLSRSDDEAKEGEGLAAHCKHFVMGQVREPWQTIRMILRLATPTPSSMGYFYSPYLKKEIDTLLENEKFDLIFVHCSSVAQYVAHVQGIPKILDFGDMDSQKWLIYAKLRSFPLNIGYWLEGTKLLKEEKKLAKQFDLCTCTTKAELDTLNDYQTGAETDWFPNGVDHEFFAPDDQVYDPDTISFIGRMDYYPNQQCMIHFCQNILPLLQKSKPSTKLVIIGANPSEEIKKLATLPGVTVTGTVDDVRPYVRRSALMIAPLEIARGTQNKILEAMAMGVPVVCSKLAAGGIDAVPGEHFLQAENAEEYVEAILTILENPETRQQFAKAGRERMLQNHHWPNSMARLDQIVDKCITGFKK